MVPVDITLLRMPYAEALVDEIRTHCQALAARLGDPGRWEVVVERRPDAEMVARARVDCSAGSATACGRGSSPAAATAVVFEKLVEALRDGGAAGELPAPLAEAG